MHYIVISLLLILATISRISFRNISTSFEKCLSHVFKMYCTVVSSFLLRLQSFFKSISASLKPWKTKWYIQNVSFSHLVIYCYYDKVNYFSRRYPQWEVVRELPYFAIKHCSFAWIHSLHAFLLHYRLWIQLWPTFEIEADN